MRVFDMLVDERRHLADLLSTLRSDQLRVPSLCTEWTVHDVAAHLTTFLRFGQLKVYAGIAATAADFDRLNQYLTRRAARRSTEEIIAYLRRHAASRVTIPRSGYDPVLADIVLHDLDIRVPLGISRTPHEDRLWVAFHHLANQPSPGFTMGSRLAGLCLHAADTGWRHGDGAPVEGPVESLLLAVGGRAVALNHLTGDGVPILRDRLTRTAHKPGPLRRLTAPLNVLLNPPPRDRRSRDAVPAPALRAP